MYYNMFTDTSFHSLIYVWLFPLFFDEMMKIGLEKESVPLSSTKKYHVLNNLCEFKLKLISAEGFFIWVNILCCIQRRKLKRCMILCRKVDINIIFAYP